MNNPDRNPNDQPQGDELLSAYLDNELSEADRDALQSQLEQDLTLRESLAELETLSQLLDKLPQHTLPDRFAEGVLRRAERQMLWGDGAPSIEASDTTATSAPISPDMSKGALARKYWWIPAALAALLAGVLFVPSLIPRANVAQMDKAKSALQQATKQSAADDEAARSKEAEVGAKPKDRQEAMALLEETVPPTTRENVPAPQAHAPAPADHFRDLAMTDDLDSDGDSFAMPPAAPAPALNFEAGRQEMKVEQLVEHAPTQSEGMAREVNADKLAPTTLGYDQYLPLIEVELPLVAGQSASLDTVASPATPSEAGDFAAGATLRGARGVANAGQLYAIQGAPEELTKLIKQFKRQGAIIRDHELPPELQSQLAKQDLQRWRKSSAAGRSDAPSHEPQAGRAGKTSQMRVQLNELRANDPRQGWFENPALQITIVELADSQALARVAEQPVRRAARKKQSLAWLQKALLAEADSAMRLAEAATAPAGEEQNETLRPEVRQPSTAQLERAQRAHADDGSEKGQAAAPGRAQLYLWVHHRSPSKVETPASEQPHGDDGD